MGTLSFERLARSMGWRSVGLALLAALCCCAWTPIVFAADAPVANAGNDLVAQWGRRVRLEGSVSLGSARQDLTYRWTVSKAPEGSRRDLSGADTPNPILALDQPGLYELQLVISDGRSLSRPDTVIVEARLPSANATAGVTRGGVGSDVDGDGIPDDIDNCVEDFNPTQYDSNGDGFGNRCDADIDNDGFVTNFGDLGLLKIAFFANPASPNWNPDADFNEDNLINFVDLGIMKSFFFGPPGPLALTFINPAGGSWHDPGNWFPPVVPNTTHTVRIDLDPGMVVEYSTGNSEVAGVLATSPILISGGDLSVAGTMQVDAPLTLQGGALSNATLLAPTTMDEVIVPALEDFTLDNVTLGADLTIENGAQLSVPSGLTLSGATVTLASTGTFTLLDFVSGEQTLDGTGEVVFGGTSVNGTIWTNNGGLLTIGPDVTVRTGTSGGTLGWSQQQMDIAGTLISDVPGNTFNLYGTDVVLDGPVQASAGASFNLQLNGNSLIDTPLTVSGGGNLSISGGAWTNATGNTMSVDGGDMTLSGNGWTNAAGATISVSGGELSLFGDWTNNGQITATNGTLDIGNTFNDEWTNNGVIDAVNTPIELGGSFALDDIGTFNTAGDVVFNGQIENTGQTLDLIASLPGNVTLGNGAVVGGTLSGAPVITSENTPFTITGVTLETDLTISNGSRLNVNGGLTLDNTTVTLNSTGTFTLLNFVSGEQTLGGTGEVVFGGTSSNNTIWSNTGQLLTIGPNITIRTGTSAGTIGWGAQQLSIEGSLINNVPGAIFNVQATGASLQQPLLASSGGSYSLLLNGASVIDTSVTAVGGGNITISGDAWTHATGNTISVTGGNLSLSGNGWSNAAGATITVDGGEMSLFGDWTNDGQITASNGTLDIGNSFNDDWTNSGVIDVVNSPVELGGTFAISDIGSFNTVGAVLFNGQIDNTGLTLDISTALPGIVTLGNGAVLGGTLSGAPISISSSSTFALTGVTLAADLTMNNAARLNITDDLTLDNSSLTLASTGTFTLLNFVSGEQTIGGTGDVVFGGTSSNNTIYTNTGQLLTIGAGITLRTGTTGGTLGWSAQQLSIQGTVQADAVGQNILIDATPTTIAGSLRIGASSTITMSTDYTLDTTAVLDIDLESDTAFGQLLAPGQSVTLGGTLNVNVDGGFTTAACDSFEILTWDSQGGAFGSENYPDLGGGSTFDVSYFASSLVLTTPGTCSGNLSLLAGVVATSSSDFSVSYVAALAIDGVSANNSSWCTANNDPAPELEIAFPNDITVTEINITNTWTPTYDFLTGRIEIFDVSDALIYDSGVVSFTSGQLALDVIPDTSGARRVVFSGVTWNSIEPCLSEFEVIGTQP